MPQATNNIELPVVSYELAVMLKEVGFDAPCNRMYIGNSKAFETATYSNWNEHLEYDYSAPELALVAEWLREIHNLQVCVDIYNGGWAFSITTISIVYPVVEIAEDGPYYDSHSSALTVAITFCLTKIKEQGK